MLARSGNSGGRIRQIILQIQNEQIAGAKTQSGGLVSCRIKIAETLAAIGCGEIAHGEIEFQHTVVAAQVFGFGDRRAGRWARAGSVRRFLRAERDAPVDEPQACNHQQKNISSDYEQRVKDLLRKLGSALEFPQYCCSY